MNCINCNNESGHTVSEGQIKICEICLKAVNDTVADHYKIENDVLAFIHRNLHGYDHEEVVNICIGLFNNDDDIIEAKACLTKVYGDKIKEINSKLFACLVKDRRDGKTRPEKVAHVRDIISVFQALDGTQCKINIVAKDTKKVPLIKDIGMSSAMPSLIEKRLTEMEAKFEGFETRFVENEQLKIDHVNMKEHITKLNKNMDEMKRNLTDAHATIVVLEAENKRLTNELISKNVSGDTAPSRPSSSSSLSSSSSSPNVDVAENNDDVAANNETEGEIEQDPAASAVRHTNQHPFHMKLSARQKHERNIQVTQASSMIAAQGTALGISPEKAAALANFAGHHFAKSFSQAVGPARPSSDQTLGSNGYPSLPPPNPGLTNNRNKGKRKLNPYQLGNKQSEMGLAAPKPEWCDKETLVIAGLDKRLLANKNVIVEKIDELAGKTINIHHMEILSKEYNHWLTIAIELSAVDYNLLNDQSFWPCGIRIRPFQGRRGWRQTPLTKNVRENSVRMSWA